MAVTSGAVALDDPSSRALGLKHSQPGPRMEHKEQGLGLEQSDTDVRTGGNGQMEPSDGGRNNAVGKGSEAALGGVGSDTGMEGVSKEAVSGGMRSEAVSGEVRSEAVSGGMRSEAVSGGMRSESILPCLPSPSYLSSLSSHYLETFFHWYVG